MRISSSKRDLVTVASFSKRDSIIYSIGIGCSDLKYLYENHDRFSSFPTIALALTLKGGCMDVQPFPPPFYPTASLAANGPVLDGERLLILHRALKPSETLNMAIIETGKSQTTSGAIVQTCTSLRDTQSGESVATIISNTFYVGVKGVAQTGKLQTLVRPIPTNQPPLWTIEILPQPNQTAIYRLSGDYNPLHIDPDFAKVFGYDMPIMHGLCTLGMATHAVVQTCIAGDESRVYRVGCRFSKPAFPGRALTVEIWEDSAHQSYPFRVRDKMSSSIVIDKAYVDTRVEPLARM
jgi:peroxisomal enoyl-CoA hydratase 2